MEVQQTGWWRGLQAGASFGDGVVPSFIGAEVCSAAAGVVMAVNFQAEQFVGRSVIADAFISQEGDQPVLEGAEATFDFAFGLRAGRHQMRDPQRGQGALELGTGI